MGRWRLAPAAWRPSVLPLTTTGRLMQDSADPQRPKQSVVLTPARAAGFCRGTAPKPRL